MIYTVSLFNDSGEVVAVLENVASPTYNRSKNAADQVTFSVPRNDSKVSMVETGMRFEIMRNLGSGSTSLETGGYISNHGYQGAMYEIEGFTEEILLSRYLTPSQFGYPLYSENDTIDDLVSQLTKSYITENPKHGWGDFVVDSSNIDYTTNPTFVLLQGSGTPTTYPSSGYVVFRFSKLASEEWERVRWVSDYYEDENGAVKTEVSYRQGDVIGSMGSFTTPQGGALTDVVGLILADPDPTYTEVRVDFETDTSEASPVLFSMEIIKRGLTDITSLNVIGDAQLVNTPGLRANNTSFLDVLVDALEPSGWEFKVEDGELSIAETFGVDRTNDYSVIGS